MTSTTEQGPADSTMALTARERRELRRALRWRQRVERWEARRTGPPPPTHAHRAVVLVLLMALMLLVLVLVIAGPPAAAPPA